MADLPDNETDEPDNVLAFPQAPDGIELRHLRSFVAVADNLNFGRAAEQLYLSQPALSRQIRALEKLVGVELLRRSTHQVELTLAGEALLDKARELLRGVDEAVSVTQSVGGELVGRAAKLWAPLEGLDIVGKDLHNARAAYEGLHAQFAPPADVTVRPTNAGGVPGLIVTTTPEARPKILYLHGGGYVLGSAFGHRPLAGAVAASAGMGVIALDYRLAPEHPFPAALDDARAAYEWMLAGDETSDVILVGDSVGGGLCLSLMVDLKQRGLPLPAGAIMFCPGVRLTAPEGLESGDEVARVIARDVKRLADAYLDGFPDDDPLVNALTADLSGFPPLLVQAATGDAQAPDCQALVDRAKDHGVDARLELYAVDTHVFQLFWSFLPEAVDALDRAGKFARAIADGSAWQDAAHATSRHRRS
jgi:acetyl esterase/lipase